MKRRFIFVATAACLLAFIFSFSFAKKNRVIKVKHYRFVNACNASVTNLTVTYQTNQVLFEWTGVNSPIYYNYGGYYNNNLHPNFSGTAYGNAISIPYYPNEANHGGRFSVLAFCDGYPTTSGGSENIAF